MTSPAQPAVPSGNLLSAADLTCSGTDRGTTAARVRRLNKTQYRNTIAVFLNGRQTSPLQAVSAPAEVAAPFTFVSSSDRYSTTAATYTMTDDELTASLESAELAAALVVSRLKADTSGCLARAVATGELSDCLRRYVSLKGELLFRRPLTDQEVEQYVGLAMANLDTVPGGRDAGIALAFQSMLVSPSFLFRVEAGDGKADAHGRKRLAPFEVAAAISYALADAPPDAALWKAAVEQRLSTREEIQAQVLRYLGSTDVGTPRFLDFMREYLRWDRNPPKDEQVKYKFAGLGGFEYPPWDARASVKAWLAESGRREFLKTALTSNKFVLRGQTLGYWDLPKSAVPTDQMSSDRDYPMTLPPEQRAGFLSFPAFMINFSTFTQETQPVQRGRYIRESFLCKNVPELPIGAVPALPEPGPTTTMRERLKVHTDDPACAGCHRFMDPIGLGFEGFTDLGMTRKTDHGKPPDASGALVDAGAADGAFVGVPQLAAKLASSPEVELCFVRHNFRYLFGREEVASDGCTLRNAQAAYRAAGGDYVALFAALITSESHLQRSPGGSP